MHPVLIELGPLKIYAYGFMLALSFLAGIRLAAWRADRRRVGGELIYDLSIILVIAAVVGSRGLYILTHRQHYSSLVDIFALWQGGATYYGGLVLALAGAFVFLRRKGMSFLRVADICAPSIALGVFFTRIGCFLSGCCFGRPTGCPLGVAFPPESPAGSMFTGHIHPTQLYSSFYGLVIFALLLVLERWSRFDGYLFSCLLVLYGIARFTVDFFRWYEPSAMTGALTFNQMISIGLVIAGGLFLAVKGVQTARA